MKKVKKDIKEITELKHEPEPGYEKKFKIVSLVITIYLCIILILGFFFG